MNNFLNHVQELKRISNSKKSPKRAIFLFISVAITLVCLYFSFKGINWSYFFSKITDGKYAYLSVIFLISSVNNLIRAFRWRLLLSKEKKIPLFQVFWANMVGYMGNTIFPARAGEIIRSVYLGKEQGISTSFVFATCIIERLFDVIALVIIGATSILILGLNNIRIIGIIFVISLLVVFGIIFILLIPKFIGPLLNWINRTKYISKLYVPIQVFFTSFSGILLILKDVRIILPYILLTITIWLVDAVGFVTAGMMFHTQISLVQALMTLASLGLASAIPSTPGYVGVYQFVGIVVLVPLGFDQEAILALITIVQIFGFLVVILWGSLGLMRFPLKLSEDPVSHKSTSTYN